MLTHTTPGSVRKNLGLTFALITFAIASIASSSFAAEVSGIKFDDQTKVANTQLLLNGAGVRYAAGGFVKAYAMGLYLPKPMAHDTDIKAYRGVKRIQLVMMREVNANDLARAMLTGLRTNLTSNDQLRHIDGMTKIGGVFGTVPYLKKGDTVTVDAIPGTGTLIYINGKRVGDKIDDDGFFDALLQIWIGPKPVDAFLKPSLLGVQPVRDEQVARWERY
jgi:Chalcone isomerase-like